MNRTQLPAPGIASLASGGVVKVGLVGLTMLVGLMLTLAGAEASGDPYGDASESTGNIDGVVTDVTGAVDGAFVQVGADGAGGSVLISYVDNVAFDGIGADLRVHTIDADFPATATIEVSPDGVSFVSAGDFSDDAGPIDIDLSTLGLSFAAAVRVTYVSGDLPGFDLDAIEALNQIDLESASIALAPAADVDPGFDEHLVTATVTGSSDGGDIALASIEVAFVVTAGPSAGTAGTSTTDALGEATFGWTGASLGLDEVMAWLDFNDNGERDEGEPAADATKLWYGDTGTLELNDVDGGDLAVDDLIEVVVSDRDLDVDDGVNIVVVTVSSTSDPVGIAVTLTETGSETGVFSAVIELAETSDEPSAQLAAAVDDIITVSYDDALDATGSDPAPIDASLIVATEDDEVEAAEEGKVTVCHRPPGNPGNQRTLSVGASALDAHLGHGDFEGDCSDVEDSDEAEDSEELTKREQAEERKAERDDAFCERKGDDHPRCRDE